MPAFVLSVALGDLVDVAVCGLHPIFTTGADGKICNCVDEIADPGSVCAGMDFYCFQVGERIGFWGFLFWGMIWHGDW